MAFVDDLADLFNETLVAIPGVVDGYGAWVASGATLSLPCRVEGDVVVRSRDGKQVTSTVQAIVGGYYNLDPVTWRFNIPARYSPGEQLVAVAVDKDYDEDGPCYETVMFP